MAEQCTGTRTWKVGGHRADAPLLRERDRLRPLQPGDSLHRGRQLPVFGWPGRQYRRLSKHRRRGELDQAQSPRLHRASARRSQGPQSPVRDRRRQRIDTGLWRSTDGGKTWEIPQASRRPPTQSTTTTPTTSTPIPPISTMCSSPFTGIGTAAPTTASAAATPACSRAPTAATLGSCTIRNPIGPAAEATTHSFSTNRAWASVIRTPGYSERRVRDTGEPATPARRGQR